jgi:hypothetical protein
VHLILVTDGFSTLEIRKIHKDWKKYQIDRMNIEALGLQGIAANVQTIMEQREFDNCKEWVEYIYDKVRNQQEAKVCDKYYLYALIIREIFA